MIPTAKAQWQDGTTGQCLNLGSARCCGLDEAALASAGPDGCRHSLRWDRMNTAGWAPLLLDEGVREDAASAFWRLRAMGLRVRLLSGDKEAAVQRVVTHLGLAFRRGGRGQSGTKLAQVVA